MESIYVIAEAGVNHNGCVDQAKKLISVAAEAGADCVKFQTFSASKLVTQQGKLAEYQKRQGESGSQLEMLQRLELTNSDHHELQATANQLGIEFLSTPFDLESLAFLVDLPVRFIKIASGELTNYPLLRAAAETKLPLVVSTGMATLQEVNDSVSVLLEHGAQPQQTTLLHCNTDYPTPFEDSNLNAIHTLRAEFPKHPIGYSDHTSGITIPIAAAAMGVTVIEKHFTLSREQAGPDHAASLLPGELKAMVEAIHQVSKAMGTGVKSPSSGEKANREIARKSIVAAHRIQAGENFSETNLTTKRPGTGRSAMDWPQVIGTVADRDYAPDDFIQ